MRRHSLFAAMSGSAGRRPVAVPVTGGVLLGALSPGARGRTQLVIIAYESGPVMAAGGGAAGN